MQSDNNSETINAYNKLAQKYKLQNSNRTGILPEIVKFLKHIPQNGHLLDLGCGVGYDCRDFQRLRSDLTILGIDASEEMIKQFKLIAPGINYSQGDILSIDLPVSTFDGIWMNASFLHIPKEKTDSVLTRVVRALKPTGIVYIRVKEGMGESMIPATKYGEKDINRFYAFYTKEELERLLLRQALSINEWASQEDSEKWISVIATKLPFSTPKAVSNIAI